MKVIYWLGLIATFVTATAHSNSLGSWQKYFSHTGIYRADIIKIIQHKQIQDIEQKIAQAIKIHPELAQKYPLPSTAKVRQTWQFDTHLGISEQEFTLYQSMPTHKAYIKDGESRLTLSSINNNIGLEGMPIRGPLSSVLLEIDLDIVSNIVGNMQHIKTKAMPSWLLNTQSQTWQYDKWLLSSSRSETEFQEMSFELAKQINTDTLYLRFYLKLAQGGSPKTVSFILKVSEP